MVQKTKKSYYFYVLYCQDSSLYAGYTTDLSARLIHHNKGKGAKYTRVLSRRPVKIIYAEQWATKSLAMSAEARFKLLTRPQKEQYLSAHGQNNIQGGQLVVYNYSHRTTRLPDMLSANG